MSSRGAGSPLSDLAPGTLIAGFQLGRVIGRGSRATVYEATQVSLDRRVALKVLHDRGLADRVRRLHWPEHPGAVGLFGAGDSEHGPWVAMRLVQGGTLETQRAPLDQAAGALETAHAAGVVHGDVRAGNVLVENGRAYLSDFGLREGTIEEDRTAFERLRKEHPPPRPGRRRTVLLGAVGLVAAAALGVVLVAGRGDTDQTPRPVPAGTRSVGSDLGPGDVESVDCNGRSPGGTSPTCTISQLSLEGRPVVAPVDGTVTSWAVRGARGTLALQVLNGRGNRLFEVARSDDAHIADTGVHVVKADLPVSAGDRVGLIVSPEGAVGVRRGRATTERWFGPALEPARAPERPAGTGLDRELLLRVDIRPRAGASTDRVVALRDLAVVGGEVRRVAVVAAGARVFLDLFAGPRRVARTLMPGADARGRLGDLIGSRDFVHLYWRNPDGRQVDRLFTVGLDGFS